MAVFDELQLFRGGVFQVNDSIAIQHPTLNHVCDYGEQKYYGLISILCSTPSTYKVELYDLGLDYETISDLNFFYLISRSLTQDVTKVLLGDIDLSKLQFAKKRDTDDIVLWNPETNLVIDELAYTLMTEFIRKIHFIEKKVEKAGNALTKKYLIERDRRRRERDKNKPFESYLIPLISSMVNCEQFKYDHKTVWDLPIYTFHDSVMRIQKIKNYNFLMQGIYAGTIDLKSINQSEMNWMGHII